MDDPFNGFLILINSWEMFTCWNSQLLLLNVGKPSTPSNVRIAELSMTSAIVLWDLPLVSNLENIVHLVYISSKKMNQTRRVNVPGTRTYLKLSGLKPSTWYNLSVQAVSGTFKGNISATVMFRTLSVVGKYCCRLGFHFHFIFYWHLIEWYGFALVILSANSKCELVL